MKKQEISEVARTTFNQVGWRELRMAGFNLIHDSSNPNRIAIQKGQKSLRIDYVPGQDLYTIKTFSRRGSTFKEDEQTGLYADMLRPLIMSFFPRFEYVMDSLRIVGWNA